MENIKVTVGEKEYTVRVSPEQLGELLNNRVLDTGWERVHEGGEFYFISYDGVRHSVHNHNDYESMYNRGNGFSSQLLATIIDNGLDIYKRLAKWQAEHDAPITRSDWVVSKDTEKQAKYFIYFDHATRKLSVTATFDNEQPFVVYFSSHEAAQQAREEFNDELLWYYSSYYTRLDANQTNNKEEQKQ